MALCGNWVGFLGKCQTCRSNEGTFKFSRCARRQWRSLPASPCLNLISPRSLPFVFLCFHFWGWTVIRARTEVSKPDYCFPIAGTRMLPFSYLFCLLTCFYGIATFIIASRFLCAPEAEWRANDLCWFRAVNVPLANSSVWFSPRNFKSRRDSACVSMKSLSWRLQAAKYSVPQCWAKWIIHSASSQFPVPKQECDEAKHRKGLCCDKFGAETSQDFDFYQWNLRTWRTVKVFSSMAVECGHITRSDAAVCDVTDFVPQNVNDDLNWPQKQLSHVFILEFAYQNNVSRG